MRFCNIKKLIPQLKCSLKNIYISLFEEPKVFLPNDVVIHPKNDVHNIPMICYQTWEERFFYKSFAKSLIKMRKENSNFSFLLYDAVDRDNYMKREWGHRKIYEVYRRAKFNPMKADIFRYCILYDKGGFYCDISAGPLKKFSDFLDGDSDFFVILDNFSDHIFLPQERSLFLNMHLGSHYLWNGFIGAKPKSDFLGAVIGEIEVWFDDYSNPICHQPRLDIISYTGPGRLTEVFLSKVWCNCKVLDIDAPRAQLNHKGSSLRHRVVPSYLDSTNQKLFFD